jgi:hypothetical protein
MTNKRDIDILIDCHDDAVKERDALAVQIADCVMYERPIGEDLIKKYNVAKLGVESTARDLENCMMIAANAEMFDG